MKDISGGLTHQIASLALTAALFMATPGVSFAQAAERFEYDALGRLIRVQTPTSTTVYS
ncbi:hypothetical protein [Brevundimonas sp.]|jgi:hypothetical protein|uniref:hypothetical protein n=1 Tax=Brevundimonas sp. TaxID=1871086 RepID=UPI003D14F0A5